MGRSENLDVAGGSMEPSTQIILSGALTFGVPLLFACRELLAMRRWQGGPPGGDGPPEPPPDVPPPDAAPPQARPMKPLPECLIPKPMAGLPKHARVRELA